MVFETLRASLCDLWVRILRNFFKPSQIMVWSSRDFVTTPRMKHLQAKSPLTEDTKNQLFPAFIEIHVFVISGVSNFGNNVIQKILLTTFWVSKVNIYSIRFVLSYFVSCKLSFIFPNPKTALVYATSWLFVPLVEVSDRTSADVLSKIHRFKTTNSVIKKKDSENAVTKRERPQNEQKHPLRHFFIFNPSEIFQFLSVKF